MVYVKNDPVAVRWPVRLDVTRTQGAGNVRNAQSGRQLVGIVRLPGQARPEQLKLCVGQHPPRLLAVWGCLV